MKIYREESLSNFEFWSGGKSNAIEFTEDELDEIEPILESEYPDGIDETELNDLLWFEPETVFEWLGIGNEDEDKEEEKEED